MTDNAIQPLLLLLANRQHLTHEQSARAFQIIMNGGATPAQMGAFLLGLRAKGETPEEIAGGAEVLRIKATKFTFPEPTLDTCGTGGDGHGTLNISTAVAFVTAGCGVPVAKHGNRAVSSQSGSADVLEALGARIDVEPAVMQHALRECGFSFLLAPRYHAALRHVAPVRRELAMRTVFNVLGPLSNPARPAYQLLGVYDESWLEPIAQVLKTLGTQRAWVVYGRDGTDELSISGASAIVELHQGEIRRFEITPEDAGLTRHSLDAIKGGDATHNARLLTDLLLSERTAYRDAVLLNAAAALVIAGKATDLKHAAILAAQSIDEGRAIGVLRKFVTLSQEAIR